MSCAGRNPGPEDMVLLASADAAILPQGCSGALYRMARRHCRRVFPDYGARFDFPGKTGQIRLFRKTGTPHPESRLFPTPEACLSEAGRRPPRFPLVFKFDWGGEGEGVFRCDDLEGLLRQVRRCRSGEPSPCLVQRYIAGAKKTLRVAVVGKTLISYWRVPADPGRFHASLVRGANIDPTTDPDRQRQGRSAVRDFCRKTGINLAGFDLVFTGPTGGRAPLFLEVNYFFGRRGLGGSARYYQLLETEIRAWLNRIRR